MNSSFKSPFSPQELPNLSEDTNIKRLKTWNCRSNQFLDFENIQIPSKSLHQSCHLPQFSCRHCIARHWPQSYSVASTLASAQITKKLRDQEKGHPSYKAKIMPNSPLIAPRVSSPKGPWFPIGNPRKVLGRPSGFLDRARCQSITLPYDRVDSNCKTLHPISTILACKLRKPMNKNGFKTMVFHRDNLPVKSNGFKTMFLL